MSIIDDLKMEYRVGGITQRLIFWNVGLFIIPMILFSILILFNVHLPFLRWDIVGANDWLSLSSDPADLLWKPWSIITYAFLHGGFLHILFNMMVLYFSGRLFLTFFTQKQLFGLYILAAIFAGLLFITGYNTLPMLANGGVTKMVGASAAIMAILIATAVYAPYMEVRLMLIGTIKLWHIALVLIALDLIQASVENTGGHLSHLAGAAFGFIYIKLLQNGTDLSRGVSAITEFFTNLFKPKKAVPFKKVHRNNNPLPRPVASKGGKDITQKQIDEILDKIGRSGYDSLTKEEKEFLFKVGK
jgi:membrane associated rhomboid family serine protease